MRLSLQLEGCTLILETLNITDFSGGITDNVIGAAPGRMAEMINVELYPSDDGMKIKQRAGLRAYTNRISAGDQTIGGIYSHGRDSSGYPYAFVQSSSKLYVYTSPTASCTEISPPDGGASVLSGLNTSYSTMYAHDTNHIFILTEKASKAADIYAIHRYSDNAEFVCLQLGLPPPAFIGVTEGGSSTGSRAYKIYYKYVYKARAIDTGETVTLEFYSEPSSAVVTTYTSNTIKVNHGTTSLPITVGYGSGEFRYTSPTDGKGRLYVVVCRTTNGGSVYYVLSTTAVATNTGDGVTYDQGISDAAVSDATLTTSPLAYFETEMPNTRMGWAGQTVYGDTAEYFLRSIKMYNSRLYVLQGADTIYQSKFAAPRMFGDTAYTNIGERVHGIGSSPGGIIAIGTDNAYRIDGVVDDDGNGGMVPVKIGRASPPISVKSVVETDEGCYWLAENGIWFTDGYAVRYLSESNKNYISTLLSNTSVSTRHFIHGVYSAQLEKIFWSISKNATGNNSSSILVYDRKYSTPTNAVIYQWYGNGSIDTCVASTSSGIYPLLKANNHGYLYYLDSVFNTVTYTDSVYTDASTSSAWANAAVQYRVKTASYDFGAPGAIKYTPSMTVSFKLAAGTYSTTDDYNLCVGISQDRNGIDSYTSMKEILISKDVTGLHTVKRHFPAGSLRCRTRSVLLSNAYTTLYNTSDYGTVEINATTKTATFTDTASYNWPAEVVGYYISFETDDYVRNYIITARSDDTLTYSDSGNYSVTGAAKGWVLRGYAKGQRFNLLGLSINYEVNGNGNDPYNTADSKDLA